MSQKRKDGRSRGGRKGERVGESRGGEENGKAGRGDKNVLRRNWQSVDRKQWGYRSKGTKRQVLDEQVLRSNGQQYSQWFNSISLSMGHRLHSKIQDS